MIINDTRNKQSEFTFEELENTKVYVDCAELLINLGNGDAYTSSYYENFDKFIPVKARLEIE